MVSLILGIAALAGMDPGAQHAVTDDPASQTIVVTGPERDPKKVRQETSRFIRSTRVASGMRPLARWVIPICPKVVGIAPDLAARVSSRVRARAAEVGAPVARDDCEGNIAIVFTEDGDAFVNALARKEPAVLQDVEPAARAVLRNGPAPIRWWYATSTGSSGGMPVTAMGDIPTLDQRSSSLISTQVVRSLTGATVVIDANRAQGVTLDAAAEYVAMLSLAEFGLEQGDHEGSILGLFQAGNPVRAMTSRDLDLLRMVYRVPLDRQARQQRSRLIGGIVREQLRRN